jgi:hypothetical protein
LEPYLRAEEEAEPFDIHQYSDRLLNTVELVAGLPADERLAKGSATGAEINPSLVEFSEIVTGHDSTEVCRMFLACLQLANMGNVTITPDLADRHGFPFSMKLNHVTSKLTEIENYRAPSSHFPEAEAAFESGILHDSNTAKKKSAKIHKQKSMSSAVEDRDPAVNVPPTSETTTKNPGKRNYSQRNTRLPMQKSLTL